MGSVHADDPVIDQRSSPLGALFECKNSINRGTKFLIARTGGVRILLLMITVAGLFLRLDFMRGVNFSIDSDEAIVGLMGKHILDGRGIPVFYYGQHYMGSLEAIFASVSFFLFGVTPFALQIVPLFFSVALIPVVFRLATMTLSQRAGLFAASLIAFAPPALLVWSSKARGGFIEVMFIGTLALCYSIAWFRGHPDKLRYPIVIGFLLGLGWWVNNQIVYFALPIAIFGLLHMRSMALRLVSNGGGFGTTEGALKGAIKVLGVGMLSFFVGGAPYWIYNLRLGFPSFGMLGLVDADRLIIHFSGLFTTALPMIAGSQRFWQSDEVFPWANVCAFFLYCVPLLLLLVSRRRSLARLVVGELDRNNPIEFIAVFCGSCCLIFAISSYGWLVQAPRYLLPFYVGLYILIAGCCEYLYKRRPIVGIIYFLLLIAFQLTCSYYGGRGVGGEPMVFGGQRVSRDHSTLIATLERLKINRIRTNYWIGYRVAFETREKITFVVIGEPENARIPEYEDVDAIVRDALPLVLVKAQANVIRPALARMGIAFSEAEAGEYIVLHNLNQILPDGEPITLYSSDIKLEGVGPYDPKYAIDGRVDTRWGTGAPQTKGQSFQIEFSKATLVSGIQYKYGAWRGDMPRELKVEIEDPSGNRSILLSPMESKGVREISMRFDGFTLRFTPRVAHRIILTQVGSGAGVDWSIAELIILGTSNSQAQ